MTKTISILIPALNEEKNIGILLNNAVHQQLPEGFVLETILVISDGSTDKTNKIVSDFSKINTNVRLVINKTRIGKIFSVGKGYHLLHSDYLVMFDADVRLKEDTVFELASVLDGKREIRLIGGNPVPIKPKSVFNIAEQASMFSWHLVQEIKSIQPNSIYSAHGRILMLNKSLYKNINIELLSTPGDDQFIYLQSENSFEYAKNAIVYYKLPSTMSDYLKQSVRFRKAKNIRNDSRYDIKKIFFVKRKYSVITKTATRNPFRFVCWLYLYTMGAVDFRFNKFLNKQDAWGIADSTK